MSCSYMNPDTLRPSPQASTNSCITEKKLPKKVMKKIVEELKTRNIGDPEVLMSNKVLEKMELMTQKIVDKLDKRDQKEKLDFPQYHE